MNGAKAIVKKELRSYFYSPLAYVLIGLFIGMIGVTFAKFAAIYVVLNAQRGGQGVSVNQLAQSFVQQSAFWLLLIAPFLTMRLFSEERNQNTIELLLTAPIRTAQLVFGKLTGAYLLLSIMVVLTFLHTGFMVLWGNPSLKILLTSYVGLFLFVGCYVSLGALMSALSSSQAIAAVMTFFGMLLLWLFQQFGQGMTFTLGPIELGPTLVYLSPLSHFGSFAEGLVQLKDVVYFVTFIGVMAFLTHRVVESNRWR